MSKFKKTRAFRESMHKAEKVLLDKNKLQWLINRVSERIDNFDDARENINEFLYKLKTLKRMVMAYLKGEYREVPWKSILLATAALLYFVTPLDFIPDFIPVVGWIDDISIVLWVFKSINDDILNFLEFELEKESAP